MKRLVVCWLVAAACRSPAICSLTNSHNPASSRTPKRVGSHTTFDLNVASAQNAASTSLFFTPNIGPFMEFKGNPTFPVASDTSSLRCENGTVRCPTGPGLGAGRSTPRG